MICQSRKSVRRFDAVCAFFLVLAIASQAWGQNCAVHPDQKLFPMDASGGDHFGASVATHGDVAIVGMPQGDHGGNSTGAAWVVRRNGGTWDFEQKLVASNGSPADKFGSSVAIDGDVAVIGAPHVQTSFGAAYVFRKQNGSWNQEAKLTVGGSIHYGASVAISGNVIVIGDPLRSPPGASYTGAAHVYKFNGSVWVYQTMLLASDAATLDQFGSSVAISGNWIVVGAPHHPFNGGYAGAAYTYHFDFAYWVEIQKLRSADLAIGDGFGFAVAIDGDELIVGAPSVDQPAAQDRGAAYVFRWMSGAWSQDAKLLAYDGAQNDLMGSAVAISGNLAVTGAAENNDTAGASGSAYTFRFDGNAWNGQCKLVSGDFGDAAQSDRFGTAVAIFNQTALIGAPFDQTFSYENGTVVFLPAFPDCNKNGIVDPCELPDCNGNRIPDECDVAAGGSEDCDSNAVPDECQVAVSYQLDDGALENAWGVSSPADLLWLNQFSVIAGHEIINFIDIEWYSSASEGFPVTVMVYDDPNNDANPSDAVLLTSVQTRAYDFASDNAGAFGWSRVTIPATFVGSPGDSFFIGARVGSLPLNFSALTDTTPPSLMRSWLYANDLGQSDIIHLPNNGTPLMTSGNFMLRAGTTDCNANGLFDGCDILNGTSIDKNGNGISDECDACRADFVPHGGDGIIGVPDLLGVIAAWGTPGQGNPADINADGAINAVDLLTVVSGWGPCP